MDSSVLQEVNCSLADWKLVGKVYNPLFVPDVGCLHAPWTCDLQKRLVWTFLTFAVATVLLHIGSKFVKNLHGHGLPRPSGTSGRFFVGETWRFYVEDPVEFVRKRVKKYGRTFYTSILRSRFVVVHSNDFFKIVLDDPGRIMDSGLPMNAYKLYGKSSIAAASGEAHDKLSRDLVKGLEKKHHEAWLAAFSDIIRKRVDSWKDRLINCYDDGKEMFIDTGMVYIFGVMNNDKELTKSIKEDVHLFEKGLTAFPFNLPGTAFRKGMQARRNMDNMVLRFRQQQLRMREEGRKPPIYSLLEYFLNDHEDSVGKEMSRDEIPVRMINVTHGQFDFVAIGFTWLIKFLSENPDVLQIVKEENHAIRRQKEVDDYLLTKQDLRKMAYSWQVIQETLRVASVLSVAVRKGRTDFEYDGFSIPKSWELFLVYRSLHYNPVNFPDPAKFDPSRFENDGANLKPYSYLPFGKGRRFCKGAKLVKLQLFTVLHYVSTRLTWTCLEPNAKTAFTPVAHVLGGYPIRVYNQSLDKTARSERK